MERALEPRVDSSTPGSRSAAGRESTDRLFQIVFDDATLAQRDGAFEVLDNTSNPRPDWYEYWPIRAFLDRNDLDDDRYYGFFSTKFRAKTDLDGAAVRQFLLSAGNADVVTFSPYPDEAAVYLSVYQQGENAHPGLNAAFRQLLPYLDYPADTLDAAVTDSRTSVFCNFFAARPRFWRAWRRILVRCMELAETAGSPLYDTLNAPARYRTSGANMKVFVMERMCTLLLCTSDFRVVNYPPFSLPFEMPWLRPVLQQLIAMDATKFAYRMTRDASYLECFQQLQKFVFEVAPNLRSELRSKYEAAVAKAKAEST